VRDDTEEARRKYTPTGRAKVLFVAEVPPEDLKHTCHSRPARRRGCAVCCSAEHPDATLGLRSPCPNLVPRDSSVRVIAVARAGLPEARNFNSSVHARRRPPVACMRSGNLIPLCYQA